MGGLIACSILAGRAIAPLAQISQLLTRMTSTRTAYRQINEMMQMPSEGPEGEALKLAGVEGKIEFRNVGFRYPGAPERALDGLSFTIEPGEHVALLGRVGSGKSTIARLILGLYPPEEGLIMIDGTDIRQLDPPSLRANVGAAMQESVLLTGSVRENIALGRAGMSATRRCSAPPRFRAPTSSWARSPTATTCRLADRGEGLSGGQRQSIAIARALAGRPPILVMDEPSSAMDAQTEGGADPAAPGGAEGPHPDPHHPPAALAAARPADHPDGPGQDRLRRPARQCAEADHAARRRRPERRADMHGTHLEDLTDADQAAHRLEHPALVRGRASSSPSSSGRRSTELDRTVRGQGRVIPSSQLQVVSNLEGGIVQDILVRQGQLVRAGDVLIRLDPTQTGAEFGSGEATVSALSFKIARLEAEIMGREPVYPAPRDPVARRPDPYRAGAARLAHGRSRRHPRRRARRG